MHLAQLLGRHADQDIERSKILRLYCEGPRARVAVIGAHRAVLDHLLCRDAVPRKQPGPFRVRALAEVVPVEVPVGGENRIYRARLLGRERRPQKGRRRNGPHSAVFCEKSTTDRPAIPRFEGLRE